jgi:hypothetical protein
MLSQIRVAITRLTKSSPCKNKGGSNLQGALTSRYFKGSSTRMKSTTQETNPA